MSNTINHENGGVIYYNGIIMKVETVTPEMAKEWLEKHYNHNRKLSKAHLARLVEYMKIGAWEFNGASIRFDKDGELIDGQHRLSALATHGQSIDILVQRGFNPEVIKTIDQEIKKRDLVDLLKMAGVLNPKSVSSILKRYYKLKNNSVAVDSGRNDCFNSSLSRVSEATVNALLDEYFNNRVFYDELVKYSRRMYCRLKLLKESEIGGIYAYLYKEKHHSDMEIQGFFNRLCASGDDINVICLLRELLTRDANSNDHMTPVKKQAYIAKTWNYYIVGKEVSVLVYNPTKEGKIEFI